MRVRQEREGRRRRHGDAQLDGARLRRARQLQRHSKLLNIIYVYLDWTRNLPFLY